jgi:hypothetical protein
MPFYLFTFRPQITEQDLFENFLTIFIPEIKKLTKYSYSVEDDSTLQKHIHVVAESKAKDLSAFKQIFNKKIFKDFKSSLKTKQTNEHGFDDKKINQEDFLKVLGYVNKETQCLRREYNFTNEEILKAVDYYYTSKHIDKSQKGNRDWTILSTKNSHVIIEKYIEDNEIDILDYQECEITKIKMIEDRYSFNNISDKQLSKIFSEIHIAEQYKRTGQRASPYGPTFHHKDQAKIFESSPYEQQELERLRHLLIKNNIHF